MRFFGAGVRFESRWVRVLLGLFFLLSGALVSLLLLLATPSFWYVPCAILWAASGFVWMVRPSLAAGLSLFPVLGIAALLVSTLPNFKQADTFDHLLLLCVAVALALLATAFRRPETRRVVPLAISLSLVLAAFVVDRAFTNKLAIHTYSMEWSVNGSAPWGNVETDEKGQAPVVIYRMVGGGYCYDAVFSPELKSRLVQSNKTLIRVEYNVRSDFGHERGYNIRSIDGLLFNDGNRALRSSDGYGGYVEGSLKSVDCR
ncbi:MAG: hypothetical protein KGL59_08130 [Acidobacteriota bacterium]|nr:hypothetical protein [Acidobacteriota bacterium]